MNRGFWNIFDALRGLMSARNALIYVLGLGVYKKLSDDFEKAVKSSLPSGISYEKAWENEIEYQQFIVPVAQQLGYEIEPQFLFSKFEIDVNKGDILFDATIVAKALKALENSASKYNSHSAFAHLFDEVDLTATQLGRTNDERTKVVSKIIATLSTQDVTASLFEEIINDYALNIGKRGGEGYTPEYISKLLAKIITIHNNNPISVYDPTCGSGSSLLEVGKVAKVKKYYGQELHIGSYNLARMNMLVHGLNFNQFDIQLGDTLSEPKHHEKFDAIVCVPPFGVRWDPNSISEDDPRYIGYGRLAPKSKADYAFIQHMLYHLDENGTMAVISPLGVLFRGAAEGEIRQYIIEQQNSLDAVISLPANLFYNTGIPTCLLIFKKNRQQKDSILFIDASNEFKKERPNNVLTDKHIQKIVDTYKNYKNVDRYARVVPLDEIKNNEFNLNIPRYIDLFEVTPIDVEATEKKVTELKLEISKIDSELDQLMKKLNEY